MTARANKCQHERTALIASDARCRDNQGNWGRASFRWCVDCGGLFAQAEGALGAWLLPNSPDAIARYAAMERRKLAAAAEGGGRNG